MATTAADAMRGRRMQLAHVASVRRAGCRQRTERSAFRRLWTAASRQQLAAVLLLLLQFVQFQGVRVAPLGLVLLSGRRRRRRRVVRIAVLTEQRFGRIGLLQLVERIEKVQIQRLQCVLDVEQIVTDEILRIGRAAVMLLGGELMLPSVRTVLLLLAVQLLLLLMLRPHLLVLLRLQHVMRLLPIWARMAERTIGRRCECQRKWFAEYFARLFETKVGAGLVEQRYAQIVGRRLAVFFDFGQ